MSYLAFVEPGGWLRRKGTCCHIGFAGLELRLAYFTAESLILAETGAISGAVQIAGTDAVAQLPFFVTACDYTLIGEELYAASAYLSREPLLLGALKGQDMGKIAVVVLLIVGSILALVFGLPVTNWFG